ncbi:Acyl-CoA dehydrogenase [Paraburkholderia sacchari]|uniref:acyl-CoA dehydrogenase family protein n=1 Tax=Paraburkholderia sacchari TaxID=159450 RepID=UPI0039A5D29B
MQKSHLALDSETKSIIAGALNRFVKDVYEPVARRKRLNSPDVDYRAHWATLAELGVLGLPFSPDYGGIGGGAHDVADALRVLAPGLLLEPLIEGTVIAGAVLGAGPDASAALSELITGDVLTVLVGARRGDDLRCSISGDGFRLSGVARVVPGAAQADMWLIACVDEVGVSRVLRVRVRDVEARVNRYRMMDGREAADITFGAGTVPLSAAWLEGQAAQAALTEATARAVSAYGAEAVGVMQSLVSTTAEYLRTREQFGVPLSSFQALQHRLADMHMAALDTRGVAHAMAKAIDEGQRDQLAGLRYVVATTVSRCGARVGHEAIQMHGGMGVTDELIVSHYNSRLVVLSKLLERWTQPAAINWSQS